MKIKLKVDLWHGDERHGAGDIVDLDNKTAERLIDRDLAEDPKRGGKSGGKKAEDPKQGG